MLSGTASRGLQANTKMGREGQRAVFCGYPRYSEQGGLPRRERVTHR